LNFTKGRHPTKALVLQLVKRAGEAEPAELDDEMTALLCRGEMWYGSVEIFFSHENQS